MSNETVLDIRPIPPAQRHPLIFDLFNKLAADESFILVNDHNPKPAILNLDEFAPSTTG